MRSLARGHVLALVSAVALCQSPPAPLAFELADVHPSPAGSRAFMVGGLARGGRYQLLRASMLDLIRTAYGLEADNVLGGPSWLEHDRFDIIAKVPTSTLPEAIPRMLQSLLSDRFGLVVHKDTKPMPAFILSLGKGKPKLKEATGVGNPGCQPQPPPRGPGPILNAAVDCHAVTMEAFALSLRNVQGVITSPVIDKTGLTGSWDFSYHWTALGKLPADGSSVISVFDALDKQLGLKLEPQKYPAAVIVVDRVNQKPSPNPPGVTTRIPPPPPTQFEVADIKPSPPDAPSRGRGPMPGGRIEYRGYPLKILIRTAWDIPSDEEIVNAPKWLDSARFDVIAKASTITRNSSATEAADIHLMLRALLADRFKLVTHYEDRPVTTYTLVAAKPKLQKADPSNRTGCKTAVAPPGKIPAPELLFQAVCHNITMAQFTERLLTIAPGYLRYPTLNATGLEGAWDFTFTFSFLPPNTIARNPAERSGEAAAAPEASEPTGSISLFDALIKQLGLKLEPQKRPMPLLVIDHINEKPTEN